MTDVVERISVRVNNRLTVVIGVGQRVKFGCPQWQPVLITAPKQELVGKVVPVFSAEQDSD